MRTDPGFSAELIEKAIKEGADLAEVFSSSSHSISAEAKEGRMESVKTSSFFGYGLRVVKDNRLGFSYSTDRDQVKWVVKDALEIAPYTEPDRHLNLPEPSEPATTEIFDPSVGEVSEERAVELACLVEKASLAYDKRISKVRKASASFSTHEIHIENSRGISYGYPSTYCSAQVMCVAEDGGDSQMGWDFQVGRFLSDVSFSKVGEGAAKRASMLLGAKPLGSSGRMPVVLDGMVAAEFISVFASMLSSEEVWKNRSLLKGKAGEKVISRFVDVIDDGTMNRGSGSRHVDDEGVPSRKNVLVSEGVLQGFLYNTHTASREGVHSTGNAMRGGFASLPSVGPANLYITSTVTPTKLDEMIGSIDKGLYIMDAMGVHTINPVSGDFSIGVSGLLIDKGKLGYPIKETVISGNLLDFFSRVDTVSDDLRFYGSVGSPSLRLSEVEISA